MSQPLLPSDDTPFDELVAAWDDAIEQFLALAETLDADDWATPSKLPGWTVGDIVAHGAHLESTLAEFPQPEHSPDWDSLAHAQTAFQKFTEYGVDYRRSWEQERVLTELRDTAAARREQLANYEDTGEPYLLFGQLSMPYSRVMRRRILDLWVHAFDICYALDRPFLDQDGPAAQVTASLIIDGFPRLVAKEAAAPTGSVLRIVVTGPDVEFAGSIAVPEDRRALWVASTEPVTATITMRWLVFLGLAGGRVPLADAIDAITLDGDTTLADQFLAVINQMP